MGQRTVYLNEDVDNDVANYLKTHPKENASSLIRKALSFFFEDEVKTEELLFKEMTNMKNDFIRMNERVNINTEILVRFFKAFYFFMEDYHTDTQDSEYDANQVWISVIDNLKDTFNKNGYWLEKTVKGLEVFQE